MKPDRKKIISALLSGTMILVPVSAMAQQQDTAGQDAQAQTPAGPVEEVVVLGRFIPDEKRSTSEISNILDAEDFQITGDSNVAGALQRVTGLSLVGGRFVYVRGLGERYSSALLDGAQLPSPEPLRRVVPLDIFPTALLEGALVQKTYSPEYPAEFGGGVIALRSKRVPDERFFSFSIEGGFNTASTFDDGLSYDGSDTDFLGFDGGKRNLPALLASNPNLEGLSPEQVEAAGEALPNVWTIDREPNPLNADFSASYGDRFDYTDGSLGILFAVDYGSTFQNQNGLRRTFVSSATGITINDDISEEACASFDEVDNTQCGLRSTEWTVDLNAIASGAYEFNNDHSLKFTSILLRKSTREAQIEQGEFAADPGTIRNQSRIEWIERQVWYNQASGEHFLDISDLEPLQLDWRASYSEAQRDAPLRREFTYIFDDFDSVFRLSARPDGNITSFGDLDDEVIDLGFDLSQPAYIANRQVDLKAGFAYYDKERVSAFRRFVFDFPPGANLELRTRIPEIIFGPVNIDPLGFVLEERTDASDSFTATLENVQFYGMIDAELSPRLRLAAGARYEDSDQFVATIDRTTNEPVEVRLLGEHLLPAATLTYEIVENMQVRLGFSQTLSRPDLRELSSANFLDPERDRPVRGNPFLAITEIDNFDARFEYYFAAGESFTIGAFYKEFEDPIERTFQVLGQTPLRSFANAQSAELIGIEAEIEKILPLSEWFASDSKWINDREFYLKVNGAYIDSEITLDPDVANQATNAERRLQGQSDVLVNAQVGYEETSGRERAALLLNFTGDRISDVGFFGAPDIIEEPPVLLDFVYAREFEMWGGIFELSLEAQNILNDEFVLRQGGLLAETFEIGTSFQVGVSAAF